MLVREFLLLYYRAGRDTIGKVKDLLGSAQNREGERDIELKVQGKFLWL